MWRNRVIAIIITFMLIAGCYASCYATSLPDAQFEAIQSLLDDACHISGVPGMSVSIIRGDYVFFFSSGCADKGKELPTDETTLYELASVSKAFTGAGILLLEELGQLSMTDSIQEYLPWFTLKYQGMSVDMQSLTLNHFLYHSSGLTNGKHFASIPQGNTQDMLRNTVEVFVDAELAFAPSEKYDYGTMNYDVLGLVIETVSGQNYESFMVEQVLEPLGLYNTYLYEADAQATGHLAQGYRSSFFITTPYNAPDYAGNKPAGYIISSAWDMARWMGIQMGMIHDIPEIFQSIIAKSHVGNTSVQDVNGLYYAAGWEVNSDRTLIQHGGGNPNFRSNVIMFPEEQLAICLLSNGANTNRDLVKNIKSFLDGNHMQSYRMDFTQLLDIILSCAALITVTLTIMFFLMGLRRKKCGNPQPLTKKRITIICFWLIITVAVCVMCWISPAFFGGDWAYTFVWLTYSLPTASILLVILSASITWFVYAKRYKAVSHK